MRSLSITINVISEDGSPNNEFFSKQLDITEGEDGPAVFTTAVECAQHVLGDLHRKYCPTDEDAAATADDAAPSPSDD